MTPQPRRSSSPGADDMLGLYEDRSIPGRFFRVDRFEQNGYLAVGESWGREASDGPWSCRAALLLANYKPVEG